MRQYATMTPSRAIVASEPGPDHHGGDNWAMTDIRVPTELKDGEILVDMVAVSANFWACLAMKYLLI